MKKIILAFPVILSFTAISCRENEEVSSVEDMAMIKLTETNRNENS